MATELPTNGNGHSNSHNSTNGDGEDNFAVKAGLARMLKGGVIMDVVNAEQVSLPYHNHIPRSIANN
jgi:pyridoxal 5'-phosphate synthase pdxS subunit